MKIIMISKAMIFMMSHRLSWEIYTIFMISDLRFFYNHAEKRNPDGDAEISTLRCGR